MPTSRFEHPVPPVLSTWYLGAIGPAGKRGQNGGVEKRRNVRRYAIRDLHRRAVAVRPVLLASGFGRSGGPAGLPECPGGCQYRKPVRDRRRLPDPFGAS